MLTVNSWVGVEVRHGGGGGGGRESCKGLQGGGP